MESDPTGVLSVIVPCFNEQDTIGDVIDAVLASALVGELIVVDDGSTDSTAKILGELDDPRVRILTHGTNRGKARRCAAGSPRSACRTWSCRTPTWSTTRASTPRCSAG